MHCRAWHCWVKSLLTGTKRNALYRWDLQAKRVKKLSSYHAATVRSNTNCSWVITNTLSLPLSLSCTQFHFSSCSLGKAAQATFLKRLLTASLTLPCFFLHPPPCAGSLTHARSLLLHSTKLTTKTSHSNRDKIGSDRHTEEVHSHLLKEGEWEEHIEETGFFVACSAIYPSRLFWCE